MSNVIQDIEFACGLKRPHLGTGVFQLCEYIVERTEGLNVTVDFCGNIHVDLRTEPTHRTLFTSHVDTVHRKDGENYFTYEGKWMNAPKDDPLGADDGAGVAILLHLIDNRVPAYYVFFQGEEKGGVGSSWLATNMQGTLEEFDRAIAFDRKGTTDIITHQMSGRCCSDEFAYALSDALNQQNEEFMYIPDDGGIYTDTAEFINLIPECTNISVGYYSEHTAKERLDTYHLEDLAKAVVSLEWDSLPTKRDPSISESKYFYDDPVGGYSNHWPTYNSSLAPTPPRFETEDDAYDYYKDVLQDERILLGDALEDALYGLKVDLLTLVSEYVMPEEPEMAMKFLDRGRLTDEFIAECKELLGSGYDESQIYEILFERLYRE